MLQYTAPLYLLWLVIDPILLLTLPFDEHSFDGNIVRAYLVQSFVLIIPQMMNMVPCSSYLVDSKPILFAEISALIGRLDSPFFAYFVCWIIEHVFFWKMKYILKSNNAQNCQRNTACFQGCARLPQSQVWAERRGSCFGRPKRPVAVSEIVVHPLTRWASPVISRCINPMNYSYILHKPWQVTLAI